MRVWPSLVIALASCLGLAAAAEAPPVRLGVLKFGTVNWEMDTITHHEIDRGTGIELQLYPVAASQALKIALQGDAVDVIVADWVWAARQRSSGYGLSFIPYSTSIGGLVVPANSPIRTLADLPGKRIGIGGGALDKSWILLQALAADAGLDLGGKVEKVFGAPPLINKQLETGRVDAVINYWHFVARLEALGHRQLWPAETMLRELGVEVAVPMLGFVFKQEWGEAHPAQILGLAQASLQAKTRLCDDDAEWRRIAPLVNADSTTLSDLLRSRYCAGRPTRWGAAERQAAARVFDVLRAQGGAELVGDATTLDPATFWPHLVY